MHGAAGVGTGHSVSEGGLASRLNRAVQGDAGPKGEMNLGKGAFAALLAELERHAGVLAPNPELSDTDEDANTRLNFTAWDNGGILPPFVNALGADGVDSIRAEWTEIPDLSMKLLSDDDIDKLLEWLMHAQLMSNHGAGWKDTITIPSIHELRQTALQLLNSGAQLDPALRTALQRFLKREEMSLSELLETASVLMQLWQMDHGIDSVIEPSPGLPVSPGPIWSAKASIPIESAQLSSSRRSLAKAAARQAAAAAENTVNEHKQTDETVTDASLEFASDAAELSESSSVSELVEAVSGLSEAEQSMVDDALAMETEDVNVAPRSLISSEGIHDRVSSRQSSAPGSAAQPVLTGAAGNQISSSSPTLTAAPLNAARGLIPPSSEARFTAVRDHLQLVPSDVSTANAEQTSAPFVGAVAESGQVESQLSNVQRPARDMGKFVSAEGLIPSERTSAQSVMRVGTAGTPVGVADEQADGQAPLFGGDRAQQISSWLQGRVLGHEPVPQLARQLSAWVHHADSGSVRFNEAGATVETEESLLLETVNTIQLEPQTRSGVHASSGAPLVLPSSARLTEVQINAVLKTTSHSVDVNEGAEGEFGAVKEETAANELRSRGNLQSMEWTPANKAAKLAYGVDTVDGRMSGEGGPTLTESVDTSLWSHAVDKVNKTQQTKAASPPPQYVSSPPDPQRLSSLIRSAVIEQSHERHTIQLQLEPEELGRLQLRVAVENGTVTAHFVAETEVARRIIEAGIQQLKESLHNHGVDIQDVEVSLGHEGGFGERQHDQPNAEPIERVPTAAQRNKGETAPKAVPQMAVSDSPGGVDVRI